MDVLDDKTLRDVFWIEGCIIWEEVIAWYGRYARGSPV
jgi:hypothetical protein